MRVAIALMCLAFIAPVTGDDPKPVGPIVTPPAITVPDGVQGDGKRGAAYVFNEGTICVLMFPTPTLPEFEWDITDGPPGALLMPGNGAVAFNLQKPGEYLVECTWTGGKSKAWLIVMGLGPKPPPGPEDTRAQLTRRIKTTFASASAKEDAAKFNKICKAVADAFEMSPPATQGALVAAWKAAVAAAQWPGGKYPDLPDITRLAMPPADEKLAVSSADLATVIANLRTLADATKPLPGAK
jgi:hypothetical protein